METDRVAVLQRLIAAVQRRWGARVLRLGDRPGAPGTIPAIPTGFPDLDAALHIGGVPRGRLTELLGTPTSGMTTIALTLLASAQERGELTGYVDLSGTFDPEYAACCGVDLATLLLVRPSLAAEALDIIHALVASGGLGVLVVDSLALFQETLRGTTLLDTALRSLAGPLAASPCALLALTPLPYSANLIRGIAFRGSTVAHVAALRLHVAREAWLVSDYAAPGCFAQVRVLKHKLAPPGGHARLTLRFDDRWSSG